MPEVSNAPDHAYEPSGITAEEAIKRLKEVPAECKLWVETAGDPASPEGWLIGMVTEIQWGRDGAVYLRLAKTTNEVKEELP